MLAVSASYSGAIKSDRISEKPILGRLGFSKSEASIFVVVPEEPAKQEADHSANDGTGESTE